LALWIASNRNHVHLFQRALRARGGADTLLSLDGYYAQGVTTRARELRLPCLELPAPPELRGRFGDLPWPARKSLVPSLAWFCRAWVERREIDALVVANDSGFLEACLLGAGRERGVPALLLQDGDFGSDWHRDRKPGQPLLGEGGCDTITLWGERGLRYAEQLDVDAKLVVTGCAKLPEVGPSRKDLRATLGLAPDTRVALFGLQCLARYGAASLTVERSLYPRTLEALLQDPAQHVVVSPHPSHGEDERRFYAELCDANPWAHYLEDPDGGALLPACDLLVALHSTLLTEAAALAVPTVCIDPSELTREAPAERVHDPSQLATLCGTPGWFEALRRRLSPLQREFASRTYAELGDAAAAPIARCVDALTSGSERRDGGPAFAAQHA
jgi:hypothetical protein